MDYHKIDKSIDRRRFLHSAAAGAGMAFAPMVWGETPGHKADDINVALLGAGSEGHSLMEIICLRKIPGIRIKAVCDIWTNYNQRKTSLLLQRNNVSVH